MLSWPYIAGFFDGEGHASLQHSKGNYRITIAQSGPSGKELLAGLKDWLGNQGIDSYVHLNPYKKHRQIAHRLDISSSEPSATRFLSGILPHLHIKKVIVQDLLRFKRMHRQWYAHSRRSEGGRISWITRRQNA